MRACFAVDLRVRDEATLLSFLAGAGFVDVLKPFSSVIDGAWTARRAPAA
jgi:hypothetical protein